MKLRPVLYAMALTETFWLFGLFFIGVVPGDPCHGIKETWSFLQFKTVFFNSYDLFIALALGMWLIVWLMIRND